MAEMGVSVQQQGRSALNSDGTTVTAAALRGGEIVTSSVDALYSQWLRAGQVFEAHFATEGGTATIEQNAAMDLTEPFFRLTVPSSKIFVPIRVKVSNQAVWTTADAIVLLTSDTDTYSSGGAAPDVRNLAAVSSLDSALGSTAMTSIYDGDSVLTEAALTNPRTIDVKHFLTGGLFIDYEYNILKGDPMVMVHGPSSFLAACKLAAAGAEVLYSVVWAELDKSALVNS